MDILDYIVIVIFSLGIFACGISFSKQGEGIRNFFAGGGNLPWYMSSLSLFMGFFSAGTFVVWGSIAYSHGIVAIIIQLTMAMAGFAVGTWIAPYWNRTKCLTVAEYITNRFGYNIQKFYTYVFLFVSIFTTGSFLYPIAKIIEIALGVPLSTSICILGIFCMIYVSIGGLRSVVVTDVLQFVILFAAVIIVIPLSFARIGGIDNFINLSPEDFWSPFQGEYTVGFIVAFGIYNMFFLGGNWAYVQRYTCVKGEKNAKKVGWLFGILYLISPILWMLPPMIYRVYNPGLEGLDSENAYLLMCKDAMPNGLLGLMLGGMIFATASSLNATLNISAGVFTNDIFKRMNPTATETQLMIVARISTLGFGLLAVIIALMVQNMGGIVNVVISIGALTGVPLYCPVIWSLYSRYLTSRVLLGVTFFSLLVNLFFKFIAPNLLNFSLNREQEMMVGVLIPIALLLVSELILRYKKKIDPQYIFYMDKYASQNPLTDNDKTEIPIELFTVRVLSFSLCLTGMFILILGILSVEALWYSLIISIILILLSVFLYYKSRKNVFGKFC